MVPNAELPNVAFGFANCGWFRTLNASSRTSLFTCAIRVFLISEKSTLKSPGPRTELRPVLPKVPVESATCWKHDVLNQRSIVPVLRFGSHTVLGRLLVMPVDSMLCACVIVNGSPERR